MKTYKCDYAEIHKHEGTIIVRTTPTYSYWSDCIEDVTLTIEDGTLIVSGVEMLFEIATGRDFRHEEYTRYDDLDPSKVRMDGIRTKEIYWSFMDWIKRKKTKVVRPHTAIVYTDPSPRVYKFAINPFKIVGLQNATEISENSING